VNFAQQAREGGGGAGPEACEGGGGGEAVGSVGSEGAINPNHCPQGTLSDDRMMDSSLGTPPSLTQHTAARRPAAPTHE